MERPKVTWQSKTCALCGGEVCNENEYGLCRTCRMYSIGALKKLLSRLEFMRRNKNEKTFVQARMELIDENEDVVATINVRLREATAYKQKHYVTH